MTENQLKYLNYQESARHNAATEAHDRNELAQNVKLKTDQLTEQKRSNLVNESIKNRDADTNRLNANTRHEELKFEKVMAPINASTGVLGAIGKLAGLFGK